MKLNQFAIIALLCGSMFITGCDDDDNGKWVSDPVKEAFSIKYPGITAHDWDREEGFIIAEFVNNGFEAKAYFTQEAQWKMTETDYGKRFDVLPQAVQNAFSQKYGNYGQVDDIDKWEYPDQATVYEIDIEMGERDLIVRFYEDGTETGNQGGQQPDQPTGNVPDATLKAFQAMYPDVKDPEWEKKQNGYYEATFYEGKSKIEAWFKNDEWIMTETSMDFQDLPQAVRTAYENSNFSNYKIDNVDKIERRNQETIYVLDLSGSDIDLQITEDGILFEENGNTPQNPEQPSEKPDNPYLPDDDQQQGGQTGSSIQQLIEQRYPNARIVDVDWDWDKVEVDIIHDKKGLEVVFDTSLNWKYTKQDVWRQNLPQAITTYINQQYAGAWIDDAELYEMLSGNFYEVEIELRGRDMDLWFDANGNLVNNPFFP